VEGHKAINDTYEYNEDLLLRICAGQRLMDMYLFSPVCCTAYQTGGQKRRVPCPQAQTTVITRIKQPRKDNRKISTRLKFQLKGGLTNHRLSEFDVKDYSLVTRRPRGRFVSAPFALNLSAYISSAPNVSGSRIDGVLATLLFWVKDMVP